MHSYAQTNIQLFNQLKRDSYSDAELACIRNAYELAMRLFTGLYRASGKTFIAHIVGTASILSSLHAPAEVVTAGVLHAAYKHGDFGNWAKGVSDAKREQVRRAFGDKVEEYVAREELGVVDPSLDYHRSTHRLEICNYMFDHFEGIPIRYDTMVRPVVATLLR